MKDEKFMYIALQQAEEACNRGEFPVGCIITLGDEIVAEGRRSCSGGNGQTNELDHAEITALRNLSARGKKYDASQLTVYSSLEPCLMCYSTLLVNGFLHIVYAFEDVMGGGTNLPLDKLAPLYRDLQPEIKGGVLRNDSLRLFQRFFLDPACCYLQDTLLARHILSQKI